MKKKKKSHKLIMKDFIPWLMKQRRKNAKEHEKNLLSEIEKNMQDKKIA
jgi:hypothetical protein